MILYLDTSSIVKLYVKESHSSSVRKWVEEAEIVASCRIAYPETIDDKLNSAASKEGIAVLTTA